MLLKTWAQNCTMSLYYVVLAKTRLQGQSVVRAKDMDTKKPILAAINKIGIILCFLKLQKKFTKMQTEHMIVLCLQYYIFVV